MIVKSFDDVEFRSTFGTPVELASGGFARIFVVFARDLRRYEVLKLQDAEWRTPRGNLLIAIEAAVLARLAHPHVVPLYRSGTLGATKTVFFTMPYVPSTLGSILEQDGDPIRVASILAQIAGALAHAHAHGVLHADVKPSNILLGEDDVAYLADWMCARLLPGVRRLDPRPPESVAARASAPDGITEFVDDDLVAAFENAERTFHARALACTFRWCAPEVARRELSVSWDTYPLASILFGALTGHHLHDLLGVGDNEWGKLVALDRRRDIPTVERVLAGEGRAVGHPHLSHVVDRALSGRIVTARRLCDALRLAIAADRYVEQRAARIDRQLDELPGWSWIQRRRLERERRTLFAR